MESTALRQGDEEVPRLNELKDEIYHILKTDEYARNSDKWLYMRLLEKRGLGNLTISEWGNTKVPSYETVSRTRRKIQTLYPNTRADGDTEAHRMVQESEYRKQFGFRKNFTFVVKEKNNAESHV